ncbi:MAG: hypothetical protein ACI3VX_00460 [Faecousia sp.]
MDEFLFDEATHTYTINGVVIPSVTEICAPITCGNYPPVGVVQQAAARGTRVHELCALYDMDALPDEIESELVGYVKAWAEFCRDYDPVWQFIERPLYGEIDKGSPFAGTLDRIGAIDGFARVVDIKTTSTLNRPSKISLCCQIAGYEWLAYLNDIPIGSGYGMGVQLFNSGKYRVHYTSEIVGKYNFSDLALFRELRTLHKITKGK